MHAMFIFVTIKDCKSADRGDNPTEKLLNVEGKMLINNMVLVITSSDSSSGIITRILVLPVYYSITSILISLPTRTI